MNGNGPVTLRLWQVLLGQVPWYLTILALGAWQASRFESRMGALERATARIEARQERDATEKLEEMRLEVERLRKAVAR